MERDPSKFYTTVEFEAGVAAIREFCLLREESVLGQLNGTIPATDAGQSADSSVLVDASHITLSDMGSMGIGGGKGGGFPGGRPNEQREQGNQMPNENAGDPAIEIIPMPDMIAPEATPDAITPDRTKEAGAMPEQGQNNKFPNGNMIPQDLGNRMPIDGANNKPMPEGISNAGQSVQSLSAILLLSVSILVLLIGLFIAKKYRH